MPLTLTLDLPPDVERHLREESPDLEADLGQAAAVELFREGRLSHFELSQVLGIDRFETDALLQRLGVEEQSLTVEEIQEDFATGLEFIHEHRP